MGTFGGHTLPGSFFFIFGIWWTCNIYYSYFLARLRREKFTSNTSFRFRFLCGRSQNWPLEGVLKIIATSLGAALEIRAGFGDSTSFIFIGDAQHATMFLFFGITGVIDVLLYFRVPLPPGLDYASMFLAFTIEYLLFSFHLHGREPVEVLLHTLLAYTVLATMAVLIVEAYWRENVLLSLTRAFLVTLQGMWFWQIAFILYNPNKSVPKWDLKDHDNMTYVTLYFAWYIAVLLVVTLAGGGVITLAVTCKYRRLTNGFTDHEINKEQYGELTLLEGSESEDEMELNNMGQNHV